MKNQGQFPGYSGYYGMKPTNTQTLVLKNQGVLGGTAGYMRNKLMKKHAYNLEPLTDPLAMHNLQVNGYTTVPLQSTTFPCNGMQHVAQYRGAFGARGPMGGLNTKDITALAQIPPIRDRQR